MLGHWINLGVEFPLDLDHIFLILFGYEVDGESDLSEPAAAADPMQIDAALRGEVKVYNNVDCLHIDAPRDEVGTNECLELSLAEAFEYVDPLIAAHVGVQALVLVLLLVEFAGEHLCAFVGAAEDDALVDDERAVEHEDGPHLLALVHQHVVVREADEHQLVHQVDHLSARHELFLEGADADGEGGRVHQQRALGGKVVDDLLDVLLEVALQQPVRLVQHEELALVQQVVVLLYQVLQPAGRADHQVDVLLLDLDVVLLDHGPADEELDIDLGELGDLLGQRLDLQRQFPGGHQDDA